MENKVYFNPKYNGIHVLYEENKKTMIVSGCCSFFDDAHTTISRHEVKKRVKKGWVLLDRNKLNEYDFLDPLLGDIALGVKKELEDKTCLFYKDNDIVKSFYSENPDEDLSDRWLFY